MSAPQIPHLSTLLGARGRGRGRGRGRSPGSPLDAEPPTSSIVDQDAIIRGTDITALEARISASRAGLLRDPYSQHFAPKHKPAPPRQMPIINRGTYVRTAAIDLLIQAFLSQHKKDGLSQIISLGAGSDPRYFRLVGEDPTLKLRYLEFDLPENAEIKAESIMNSPELKEVWTNNLKQTGDELADIQQGERNLASKSLSVIALDIRKLASQDAGDAGAAKQAFKDVEANVPTIILSECCLCYLQPETASTILKVITTDILAPNTPCGIILYEPILPHDVFGKRMTQNLLARNIAMPTLEAYPTLSAQRLRLKDVGFTSLQGAADCSFIWKRWIQREERERVDRFEMLDEVEEWDLLAGHYCVAWGARDGIGEVRRGDGTVLVHSDAPRNPMKRVLVEPSVSTPNVETGLFTKAWSSLTSN